MELLAWLLVREIQGMQVLIKCNDYSNLPSKWKNYAWGTDNALFPVVMIDDHITW